MRIGVVAHLVPLRRHTTNQTGVRIHTSAQYEKSGPHTLLLQKIQQLFGVRAGLQFGKLLLQTVVSQKTSSTSVVDSKGGTQLTTYEIEITDYDENKHFFLAHYFRDNYDRAMSMLPTVLSGVSINREEV